VTGVLALLCGGALAEEPARHAPQERVLVDTLTVGSATAPLVIGPCGDDRCALQVQGAGSARAPVWSFDRGPYQLVDVDHGWMVHTGTPEAFSLAWEPFAGVAPTPTALVHIENSPEHIIDRWFVVTLDEAPAVLWSGGGMYRTVGPAEVRPMVVGEQTWVVQTAVVGRETAGGDHDDAQIEAFRFQAGQAELVAVPDAELPLYAVVVASFPHAEEADPARSEASCLHTWWQLDSTAYPKLAPGLTVLGKVTPDRALAERWLSTAQSCRPDAYLKRAR